MSEIVSLQNLRLTLEVNFYGEESEDQGGPRKEFFGAALNAMRTEYFTEDGLLRVEAPKIAKRAYYACGLILGLSALEGGPCSPMINHLQNATEDTEAHQQFRKGLKRVGIWQILERKYTFKYLFQSTTSRLTVQKLVHLLEPKFSTAQSTARQVEEQTYSLFIKYIRQAAAGRHPVTLCDILKFITGAEEEPVLGFSIRPSVEFTELPGSLPSAATCVNLLYLPTNILSSEEKMFERFTYSFTSDYFGRR